MTSPYDDLHHLIDRLPSQAAGELLNFGRYLEQQARQVAPAAEEPAGPTDEDRAWLAADLVDELEPYDWGPGGEPAGTPVRWDPERGEFVAVEAS